MAVSQRDFPPYVVCHNGTAKLVVPLLIDGEKIEIDFDLKQPTAHRMATALLKYLDPVK